MGGLRTALSCLFLFRAMYAFLDFIFATQDGKALWCSHDKG